MADRCQYLPQEREPLVGREEHSRREVPETPLGYELINTMEICLLFYVLPTSTVISGWVMICNSAHSWQFYNAVPLEDQATGIMTSYPTQSYDTDTELTSPRPFLSY